MLSVGFLDLGKTYAGTSPRDRWRAAVDVCQTAERVGFDRYWMAEHHVADAAFTAPEAVLPVLAYATSKIRIGPAGVLLPYYSPLKIAEVYLTMAAAFGARIELGVCRGPGVAGPLVAERLTWGNSAQLSGAAFERKVQELASLLGYSDQPADDRTPPPAPLRVQAPQVYVLGSSIRSVRIAVENALPYAYMCFYPSSLWAGPELLRRYRTGSGASGRAACIALSVICEKTEGLARARHRELVDAGMMPSNIVGEPAGCAAAIRASADAYGVSSVVLASFDDRLAAQLFVVESLGAELKRQAAVRV